MEKVGIVEHQNVRWVTWTNLLRVGIVAVACKKLHGNIATVEKEGFVERHICQLRGQMFEKSKTLTLPAKSYMKL